MWTISAMSSCIVEISKKKACSIVLRILRNYESIHRFTCVLERFYYLILGVQHKMRAQLIYNENRMAKLKREYNKVLE